MAGYSVIADVGERRAVANSTLEMPSRETVKSHQLAHIPFVPWSRTCVAGQGREGPHFSQMGGAEIVVLSDNTFGELERLQRTHKKDAEKLETAYQKLTTASEMILRLVKAHDSQAEQIAHSVRENECLARDLVQSQSELEVVCRRLESLRSIPSSSQPSSEGRLGMPVKDSGPPQLSR